MQDQLKQLKPQIEASVEAAYEVANLALSQVERATELALAQSKQNAVFAREQMNAVAYQAHPYRRPIIGWMNDLETMTAADANVETFTALLDARFVAGNRAYFDRLIRDRRDLVGLSDLPGGDVVVQGRARNLRGAADLERGNVPPSLLGGRLELDGAPETVTARRRHQRMIPQGVDRAVPDRQIDSRPRVRVACRDRLARRGPRGRLPRSGHPRSAAFRP